MKKNILFSSYSLCVGGIEKSLINLLNSINYNKYKVTLILEKKEGILLSELNKNVIIEEYKVSENKIVVIRKIINFVKRMKWIIKNYHKYDFSCCYATYSLPNNFQGYYGSKNNAIFIHNTYTNIYKTKEELDNFFIKRRINKYKNIIFVSNESRNELIKMYPNIVNNSYVINNLIDTKGIIKLSKEKILEKKQKDKLFVYIGRLDEQQKRISKMINIFNKLKNMELWLIGDGPNKDDYIKQIKNDNIKLLGERKNPYPYIKASDYIIFTSDYEGFPVVYNEAIILNKTIITTLDLSDDYISLKNRFGYIIDKNEDKMLKDIQRIINNDNLKKEKVDFDKLNNIRIKKIESIIEGDNIEI